MIDKCITVVCGAGGQCGVVFMYVHGPCNKNKNAAQLDHVLVFPMPQSQALIDPVTRLEYDFSGCYEVNQYTARVRGLL